MPNRVTVIVGTQRIPVPVLSAGDPPLVPAQHLVIEIEGDVVPRELLLNDEPVPVIRTADGRRGHTLVDRFRSTAFHRLHLDGETYCFGTNDAKLELDGILNILNVIEREGLSWGQQIIFSSGAVVRDARVDYAWLRAVGREILEACATIAAQPVEAQCTKHRLNRPRGGRVRLSDTLSLIRGNPRRTLENHERGIVRTSGGRNFMPRRVVSDYRAVSHDTVANRRATRLLLAAADLAAYVARSPALPRRHRQWIEALLGQLNASASGFPFINLIRGVDRVPEAPSVTELMDPRYQTTFRIHNELTELRGWQPSRHVSDRFAYVGYSDEIYQAFVAMLLANAFGMQSAVPSLQRGLMIPCYRTDQWELYYDTAPPRPHYRSWRDASARPAVLTPDYCIVERHQRLGILGDAKYRATRDRGRLPSSSLNDCQVYMQHFDVRNFAVFYPGPERLMAETSGDGNTILEVSVTPFQGVSEWMRGEVRPRLEQMLEPLQ